MVLDQGGKEIDLLLRQVELFPEYRLKMLRLLRCSVPKEVMEPLVLYFSSLTLLDLSESHLPKEGFDILGRALQGNSRLKKLNLTAVTVEGRGGIEKKLWGLIEAIQGSSNRTLRRVSVGQVEEELELCLLDLFSERTLKNREGIMKITLR
jgi:hypothetical protein